MGRDLLSLLGAIKSSDVVENRIQLLCELSELELIEKSDVELTIGSLIMFWEDFTCLDISQCTLNKTILLVASKYLEADISACLGQFLGLGIKASVWCRKHLKMTLMSSDDSPEEEHSSLFYQLLLDLLSYSSAAYSASARYPVSGNKELMIVLGNFISEQLTLTKDSVAEIKSLQILSAPLLKAAHMVIDSVTRLCKTYSNGINWDVCHPKSGETKDFMDCTDGEISGQVINVINCAVERLCELGILAANDGGSLVSLLNLSWKGVVSLLQLGKGALAVKVNIAGVIMSLISLANESLRCAAETWSSSLNDEVSSAEAKRIFLPVKFFLINAVRIISQYPFQALSVYKDVALCVIMILTFKIALTKDEHFKLVCEVLAEILEPISMHLLNAMLNSTQVSLEKKLQILEWLFSIESAMDFLTEDTSRKSGRSLGLIFSANLDTVNKVKILYLGRVALFLNLLKSACDLEDDVRVAIARKLGWLLDILIDGAVYSAILALQIPTVYGSSEKQELVYQSFLCCVVNAIKTFMIVVSSGPAWVEVESFLLENIFHAHFLCWEIVTELWCFILRHAEPDMANDIIDMLCLLSMDVVSPDSISFPSSALRKIARLICLLVTHGSQLMADRVYNSIVGNNGSQSSSAVYTALLMEGFPLNFLPESTRCKAKQRIISEYFDFLDRIESSVSCASDVYGAPVFALSAALQSRQVSLSDTEMKTLKFFLAIVNKYRSSSDYSIKDNYQRLLSETLRIISNMKHFYACDEMEEVILELQNLFISRSAVSDGQLFLCKPNLAYFMAGLGHVKLVDSDESAQSRAVWELYYMLLRERHWALAHLGITAFGYFAAHTSCNELWRFVPQDAALSFDVQSGNEADEERFMSELKVFLEKEMASPSMKPCTYQLTMLVKEGLRLGEMAPKTTNMDREEVMEIDDHKQSKKKRKLPDDICKGMELLQSGLKIMNDGLSHWQQNQTDSSDIHEKFLTHFPCLEDVITHLVSLAGSE